MPIEYTIIISVITVVCTILGVSIGMSNHRSHQRADDKRESIQFTKVEVQLGHIGDNVNKIVTNIDDIKKEIKEHRDRLVLVEYDTKQARKEIAEMAARRRGDMNG